MHLFVLSCLKETGRFYSLYYRFTVTVCLLYIKNIILRSAKARTDGRTDGRTNVPANGVQQEQHATEILITKGITKMFRFSKSGPWNSFLRYTPKML